MMIFDKRLYSCPLCGSKDVYFEEKYFGDMIQIDVGCAKCGLKGSKFFLSTAKDIEEKVIEYWNYRVLAEHFNQALEDSESKIKEYCENDVIATEAAFNYLISKKKKGE